MFRPPGLLATQVAPTAVIHRSLGSRGVSIRACHASLPPHAPDMLAARMGNWRPGTFTPSDSRSCRLLLPSTASRPASQTRPARTTQRLSPLPAFPLTPPVCLGPSRGDGYPTPWCFPGDSPHGHSGRVLPHNHAAGPHGSFAPEGLCCPFPRRHYDPIRQSRRHPRTSRLLAAYTAGLRWAGVPEATAETFPALAARLSSIAVLYPRRETARLLPPNCFGERIGHRANQKRLASPFPTVSLEHPEGFLVGWCHGAIGSPLLRPSKLLAPPCLTDRDAHRHRAAGTCTPELAPKAVARPRSRV